MKQRKQYFYSPPEKGTERLSILVRKPARTLMARLTALLMAILLVLPVSMTPGMAGTFSDLDEKAWYVPYIEKITDLGWMNGSEGLFRPDQGMSRAMILTVLHRIAGTPRPDERSFPFVDADPNAWYGQALQWAWQKGIANGMSDSIFEPDRAVTREQLVLFCSRYFQAANVPYPLESFSDAGNISPWARDAVQWALSIQAFNPSASSLNPERTATRAESAKILLKCAGVELNKLSVSINGQVFYAGLEDNASAKAFCQRLPITKEMKDAWSVEKYCYLVSPLPTVPTRMNEIPAGLLYLLGEDSLILATRSQPAAAWITPLARIEDVESLQQAAGEQAVRVQISLL